jgi:hypothetical protein
MSFGPEKVEDDQQLRTVHLGPIPGIWSRFVLKSNTFVVGTGLPSLDLGRLVPHHLQHVVERRQAGALRGLPALPEDS